MKVIVFSKDRPMQLQAYLESLIYFTNIKPYDIYILFDYDKLYESVISKFRKAHWISDSGDFDKGLRDLVKRIDDEEYVLTGCDDVVYFRQVDLDKAEKFLEDNLDCLGFSLRLGKNTRQAPKGVKTEEGFIKWVWHDKTWHWGYPFELMGSIYKASRFKMVVNTGGIFRCPNDLEGRGDGFFKKASMSVAPPCLAMFDGKSACAAQDINRVQHYAPNRIQGTAAETADNLKTLFKQGFRIDWRSMHNIAPIDCFIGRQHLRLRSGETN